jgi:acyl carrier protein
MDVSLRSDSSGTEVGVFKGHSFIQEIQRLFLQTLSVRVDAVEADLLQTGILDSMTLVQLIASLEERFGLQLPMEDLELESFRSLSTIAQLIVNHKEKVSTSEHEMMSKSASRR